MASGQVNRAEQAEHMAAPTNAANVKKVLANSEPSTHGPSRKLFGIGADFCLCGQSGKDLLTLSSSLHDPQQTFAHRRTSSGLVGNSGHNDYRAAPPSPTITNGAQNAGCAS